MTEADTESIWDVVLDTTRFGNIGVRIAEQINFWVNESATSQVTDTGVTPILEQLSEEILIELINVSKLNKFSDPWTYMQANVVRISSKVLRANRDLLKKIQRVLGKRKVELVRKTLPSSTSDW